MFTKWPLISFLLLRKEGHQSVRCLYDTFLKGDTFNRCKDAVLVSAKLVINLGFFIYPEKSKLFPSQVIEFLGFIINSKKMTVSLSESKQNSEAATGGVL